MIAAISHLQQGNLNCKVITLSGAIPPSLFSEFPYHPISRVGSGSQLWGKKETTPTTQLWSSHKFLRAGVLVPRSSGSSNSNGTVDESPNQEKAPFGYTRKDVLLIGLGVTAFGVALKNGLEFVGVDPLQAGNVVQLLVVLGMTVGWISTYMFRVASKDMTYAQQLRDYEYKVMEKRLEGLTEAELQVLLEQVEEEKRSLATNSEQTN